MPDKLPITSALAGDIIDEVRKALEDIVPLMNEKLQFLVDSELIEPEDGEEILRGALHVAIDFALEDCDDECCDDDEDESECCASCGAELEDEDEETNPV
jgi:hypothetical protein